MFFGLVKNEIKYQLKSIVPYLLLIVIFLFYFSQYAPGYIAEDVANIKPVSEMQFMYNYIDNIAKTGVMTGQSYSPTNLTKSQLQDVKNALKSLQAISVKDKYEMMQPTSQEQYLSILTELDNKLGGNTIFSNPQRERFLSRALNYGSKEITDDKTKMLIMFKHMIRDYHRDSIYTYPIGFAKKVILTPERKEAIKNALNSMANNGSKYINTSISIPNDISFSCSYQEFINILDNLDKDLGGGSDYSASLRNSDFYESKSYEEAQVDYISIVNDDKISNAYARLYADYVGITASLFPIFLAAFVLPRDKRYRMSEIIGSKKVKSTVYVLAKYVALIILILVCYMIVATHATLEFMSIAKAYNLVIDNFAFYSHTLIWVLPTIMFVVAVGMLLSVIFKRGVIAIPFQFILCNMSIMPLMGNYSLSKFFIRFNGVVSYNEFQQWSNQIINNRIFYVVVSLILIVLTSFIWSRNRSSANGFNKTLFKSSKI